MTKNIIDDIDQFLKNIPTNEYKECRFHKYVKKYIDDDELYDKYGGQSDIQHTSSTKEYENNENNGLLTKIWGPPMWETMHCISFGYPIKPSEKKKEKYMEYYKLLGSVLPCKYCRISYKNFISEYNIVVENGKEKNVKNDTALTYDVMESRDTLTKWVFNIHEKVNKKLCVTYGVTYEDIVKKYESYRAKCLKQKEYEPKGCVYPLRDKATAYIMATYKECAIIPIEFALNFYEYAKKRGLVENDFYFIDKVKNIGTDIKYDKYYEKELINCDMWHNRNVDCDKIKRFMWSNKIESVEIKGDYRGLPTIYELKLIMRLCSNLTVDELQELSQLLKNQNMKKYKLVNNKGPFTLTNKKYILDKFV